MGNAEAPVTMQSCVTYAAAVQRCTNGPAGAYVFFFDKRT
jgi:hypothetical protein